MPIPRKTAVATRKPIKKADVVAQKSKDGRYLIFLSWALLDGECFVRVGLYLTAPFQELSGHNGGVPPVLVKAASCDKKVILDAWSQFKSRVADRGSALYLALTEAIDAMEYELQKI